jgi:hypothetical protein
MQFFLIVQYTKPHDDTTHTFLLSFLILSFSLCLSLSPSLPIDVVAVMAVCGLSYTVTETSDAPFSLPFGAGDRERMNLEPAIGDLVLYSVSECNSSSDSSAGGNGDDRHNAGYHNSSSSSGYSAELPQGLQNDPQARRQQLSQELKNIIFMEHKQYVILSRVSTVRTGPPMPPHSKSILHDAHQKNSVLLAVFNDSRVFSFLLFHFRYFYFFSIVFIVVKYIMEVPMRT